MYECGTGKKPFTELQCSSVALVMRLMMGSRPIFPQALAPGYRSLAEKCWNQDASLRPTFDSVVAELAEVTSAT